MPRTTMSSDEARERGLQSGRARARRAEDRRLVEAVDLIEKRLSTIPPMPDELRERLGRLLHTEVPQK